MKRLGLINVCGKTNTIVCTPGLIWGQQGKAVCKRRATGEGDTFWEQKKTRVIYK